MSCSTSTSDAPKSKPLDAMGDITRLNARTVRILGQNPSTFTLNGTNTYLLMPPSDWNFEDRNTLLPAMLVDTGDAREDYAPILEQVLRGNLSMQDDAHAPVRIGITDIILTHWHHDHVGGVPFVLRMLDKLRKEAAPYAQVPVPRIFKFPEPVTDPSLFERVERVPLNAYLHVPGVDGPARMMWPLRDNMTIRVRDPEDPTRVTSVRALYTPGHAADHMMFLLEEDNILLTGDNVLGRGSTVFEDLILYMHGIQRGLSLLTMRPATPLGVVGTPMTGMSGENVLFPGHGPVIPKGKETLRRYLKHRVEREEQLLALLTCRPGDKERVNKAIAYPMEHIEAAQQGRAATHVWTLRQFVSALYENYALNMYPAVARVLLLHLQKLSVSPAEHKAPPFPTRQTVPSTAWALTGPLVRCASLPSFQRTSQPFPDLPSNDTEWREMLDLPWCLSAA